MLRESLIQFLSSKKIEKWPEWLPVIVHELGEEDIKRAWDKQKDIGVIVRTDVDLDSEVESLKSKIEGENFRVVQLWNKVSDFPLSEEMENSFNRISGEPEESNNDLRRIMLNFMFENPSLFSDSVIKEHLGEFPQKTPRYPVIAERTDVENKPLVMIPSPSEHWKYARINIMKEGGKIWFPTHMNMRGKRTSKGTIPPKYREDFGTGHDVQNSYSYLPNDISSPLTMQRGEEEGWLHGPNVIHWDHDFHPANLTEALELSIKYLRESKFVPDRPQISLSGDPDLEIGDLRIIAAGEEVMEMIASEDAFKLPSLLNTTYMPKHSLIKMGLEDKDGATKKIHDFTGDPYPVDSKYFSFHPTTWETELGGGMETWNKHLFNWNLDEDKPREERGKDAGDVWKARIKDEGDEEKFNYSILVRDIRLDYVLLEMAMGDPNMMALALNINRLGKDDGCRIKGGLWIFEGYWSKTDNRQRYRELRFDEIPQSYNPNLNIDYRYVNGEPRVTVIHSSFSQWRDSKLLGFSEESSHGKLESGARGIFNLLPDNWIPCDDTNDEYVKLLERINISVVEVDDETFAWSLGVDVPPTVTNPWKKRLQELCKEAKKSNSTDQRELLKQIDKIANVVKGSDKILRSNNGLKGIDQTIIEEFPELAKICSGIGSNLRDSIASVLLNINKMELDDIMSSFQGVNLCNWKYDYTTGKFIASDETGLTGREFIVVTPKEAEKYFAWKGNQHSFSEGEWKSKGFGLKDGTEMIIFDDKIAEKIQQSSNISKIEHPNLQSLREVILRSENDQFKFLGSILTLDFFEDQVLEQSTALEEIVDSLQSRRECSLIDSDIAEQNLGVTLGGNLTIGPGGWGVVDDNDKYFLLHGKMPDLLWSMELLKTLMKDCGTSDDVLRFSLQYINSYQTEINCQNLIAAEPNKEDFVNALLGKGTGESFLFESLNPWSRVPEERESYRRRFTLEAPKQELYRGRLLWEKREAAKEYLKDLQDSYKRSLEDGNLWNTPQNRALLEAMYIGRICILEGKQHVSSNSDDTADFDYPRHRTTISSKMIRGQAIEEDANKKILHHELMGNTLITSADAQSLFGRTSDTNRYDLIENFYEKMRDVVNSDIWDNDGDWVLTDSIVKSPSDDMTGIWLHKLHHLHIVALYSAISELGE